MNHHLTFQLLTLHSFSTSPLKDHPHPHPLRPRHPRLGSSVSESDSLKQGVISIGHQPDPKLHVRFFCYRKNISKMTTQQHFTVAACFFKPHLKKTCGNFLNDSLDPKSTRTLALKLGKSLCDPWDPIFTQGTLEATHVACRRLPAP